MYVYVVSADIILITLCDLQEGLLPKKGLARHLDH